MILKYLIILKFQRNTKYKNLDIIIFVINNFRFKNVLINACQTNTSVVTLERRLKITQNYNRYINF